MSENINKENRYKSSQKVIWITIFLNTFLSILKIVIGLLANSNAMLADGIHSMSDVGSSLGIIVGLFIAKKPEDKEHQYGHEKAETIATFMLSMLLIAVGLNIGYSSVKLIFSGDVQVPGVAAIWAAIISIIVKEIQFRISMRTGKKINSDVLIADAWHHRSDALSSIAALIGIIGSRLGYGFLDPLAGLIVSIIVVKVGVEIFIKGTNELMDESLEEEKLIKIVNSVLSHKGVKTINDIKARKHGSMAYVDIEIAVDPNISVIEGHDIAEDVENIVYEKIDNIKSVLVHVNPCCIDMNDCKNCNENVSTFVKRVLEDRD
ncbi:cation diffusion facilitator family transporter [Anaeromonas gelatinilytica]|uniref:cation diffusion facilitator family transporter n=1 Tax=Anaeromonas gelatinilytica TaxID=2683194 RepID=UPI001A9C5E55|nr:cation diffusion facilitator family transporter [Anaeromonas gelatinilytica]